MSRLFHDEKLDEALESWGDVFLWERTQPKVEGRIMTGGPEPHDAVHMEVPEKDFDADAFRRLVTELHRMWGVDFAYAALVTSADMEDLSAYQRGAGQFATGVYSRQLKEGLPWLPWLTFFGSPYIELFGAETLRSAPAHRTTIDAPGLIDLQLTASISNCVQEHQAVENVRTSVVKHLGENAFLERTHDRVAPDFGWDQLEVDRRRGVQRQ